MLEGKKVIAIGDKDGISGPVIEKCVKSAGAEAIFTITECFGCSIGSVINIEIQEKILKLVEKYGYENVIVVFGGAEVDITELSAEAIVYGDTLYGGPLKNLSFKLPVYHVLEDVLKSEYNQEVYEEECSLMELVLEVDSICNAVKNIRMSEEK